MPPHHRPESSEIEVKYYQNRNADLELWHSIIIQFIYDPKDSFAVNMKFVISDQEDITWAFARQMLTEGLTQLSGHGDIQIAPTLHSLMIQVRSDTTIWVLCPRQPVADFVQAITAAVPDETESLSDQLEELLQQVTPPRPNSNS